MVTPEYALCWVEEHAGNPGLTLEERTLLEWAAESGKRVDIPGVCIEHGAFLKLQEKGLVYTDQPVRHGHICWWWLTEKGEQTARELGFKVKGNPGKPVGLEAYFGEAVPVLRTEKAPILEEIKPVIPFKIKISYSKYKMKTEHEVLTTGLMRGMGWRAGEQEVKVKVTIPWLTSTYAVLLDDVMAGIGFHPTKRSLKNIERGEDVYLRETSTLYTTEENKKNALEVYKERVRRVLDKLYEEEKEWEPVAVRPRAEKA